MFDAVAGGHNIHCTVHSISSEYNVDFEYVEDEFIPRLFFIPNIGPTICAGSLTLHVHVFTSTVYLVIFIGLDGNFGMGGEYVKNSNTKLNSTVRNFNEHCLSHNISLAKYFQSEC